MAIITEQEAMSIQRALCKKVIKEDCLPSDIKIVAGTDVAYEKEGDRLIAAIVLLDAKSLKLIDKVVICDKVTFPYIPGLFSFRELPPLKKAFEQLHVRPDLIICDGQGVAHPRRFGLASHLGVVTGIPTIGCAKTRLVGDYKEPQNSRGDFSELIDQDDIIGRVVRTQDNTKPVYVSIGHKVSLETACDWILKLCPKFRLPETTRIADHAVNMKLKELQES